MFKAFQEFMSLYVSYFYQGFSQPVSAYNALVDFLTGVRG